MRTNQDPTPKLALPALTPRVRFRPDLTPQPTVKPLGATRAFRLMSISAATLVLSLTGCSSEAPGMWTPPDGSDPSQPGATAAVPGSEPGATSDPNNPGATSPGVGAPSPTAAPGTTGTAGSTDPALGTDPLQPGATPTTVATTPLDTIEPGAPIPLVLDGNPTFGQFVRLSHTQWENSVQQLLALSQPPGVADTFASDAIVGTFSNNEKYMTTTQTLVADYERATEDLVNALTDQSLRNIYPGTDAQGFITTFGRRAYRRPLTGAEVDTYMAVYDAGTQLAATGSDFLKGAGLVIQTMLQSPYFIYRMELGEVGQPLVSYEMASKLSLALLDVTPDDALLDAAAAGQLDTPEGVASKATEMLNDPRAVKTMRRFHGEALQFKRFDNVYKDPTIVPEFTDTLPANMLEAAYLFFDRIFTQNLGVRDIFTSTVGFVNADLAPLYGLTAPALGFQEVDLGAQRQGYFSQVPYLVLHSVNLVPDSIHRGVDLNLKVLCAQVDAPAFTPPPLQAPAENQSNRQLIEQSTSSGVCAGCHGPYINPLGFAFENFDGMGRLRTEDRGNPVDTVAKYPFTEGEKTFNDNTELMDVMAESEQAHDCYSKNMMQFMLGRELTPNDMPEIEALAATSQGDSSIKSLIVELVKSPSFRMRTAQ